jgi:Spy/CpxP family protein refolding chaperone
MNTLILSASLVAAVVAAPLVASAAPREGRPGRARPAGDRAEGGRGLRHRHARRHARHGLRMLKSLDLTDAQKALLADARAGADPVRSDLRAKVRAILETPVTPTDGQDAAAARAARRAKVKEAVQAAVAQVEPSATKLVFALSPEQKAKLAEHAAKHGKTFDEAKLTKRVARFLLAPGRHGRR